MKYTFDTERLSDLYKDAYGHRPDYAYFEAWHGYPDDFKQIIWNRLLVDLAAAVEEENYEMKRSPPWRRANPWNHEKSSFPTSDPVNSPSHYTSGGIETIDYMEAKSTPEEFRGHLRLSAVKYLSRAGLKHDTLEDLKKARWYINALIEFIEDPSNGNSI
jgi:hypothetical protein